MRSLSPSVGRLARLALGALLVAGPAWAQEKAPAWTRGATCYEVFVRSFADGDGDGVGDFKGLTARLDYINDGRSGSSASLGARCIWLMPIDESPSYHGYDVADYYKVDKEYGTNDDFKRFMQAAHARGIKVLVDLVPNHSSRANPWFQAASRDTASRYRSWYRFSAAKPNEKGPWGQDVWVKSPARAEYYYAVFSGYMPDLNWGNPEVLAEFKRIAKFWIQQMHVDGFRLDAVSYMSEDNGRLQHSPGTHAALRDWQAYVRTIKPDVFTVGEVYAPIDTVLPYYPDQLTSYFAFEVADSIVAGVARGSAAHVLDPALRLQRDAPAGRWSPFLRNHDQPRTRTELGGDMAKARVASLLLLTMPGMPFLYYGEEIGMTGAKPDERLRTPMQWTAARGAGFTTGTPWERLADDSATTTVAAQERDPSSLLAFHRRLVHLRDRKPALSGGEIIPLAASNGAVTAYVRRDGARAMLVVANLGATPLQGVTLASTSRVLPRLPRGRWMLRDQLGTERATPMTIAADGSLSGYVPLATLGANQGYLFELVPFTR